MSISFISLNLCGGTDWKSRLPNIVDFLNTHHADIVLLQEVRLNESTSLNQASEINRLLADSFPYINSAISRFYRPSVGEPYREGLTILSRHPMANSEVVILNQALDDRHSRIIQLADIVFENNPVTVCNVHFSNNVHSVEQLSETLSIIENRSKNTVIAGDFNIFSLSDNKSLYDSRYTSSTEVGEYISFPTESKTLDYVLVPKPMNFSSFETVPGLSDHSALLFTVDTK